MAKARKTRSKDASTKGVSKRASKTDFKFGANKGDKKNAGRKETGSTRKSTPNSKATNKASSKRSNANTNKTSDQKSTKEKTLKKRFVASRATRKEKFRQAQKIGKDAYYRRIMDWWDDHPDAEPDENPYCYHNSD